MKKRITASELGVYVTCKRAWWYQNLGLSRSNSQKLEAGQEYHRRTGIELVLLNGGRIFLIALLVFAVGMILYSLLSQG